MKILLLVLSITTLSIISCRNSNQILSHEKKSDSTKIEINELTPLDTIEIHFTDEIFGKVVNLFGQPLNTKEIMRPYKLFVNGDYLITLNQRKDSIFMIHHLPDLTCITAFGTKGIGPDEFIYPQIFETYEDSILFYIYEKSDDKIFKVSKNSLKPEYLLTLPKSRSLGDKQIVMYDNKSAYYADSEPTGRIIYFYNKDSLPQSKQINNLAIKGIKSSWTTLIGDFGYNKQYSRIVYAYKYFKRLRIIDAKTLIEKEIIFDAIKLKDGLNDIETLEPTNVTHFWGISAKNQYFWMLYSGRTPVDVQKDNSNNKKYIYVEQYDWNGNPMKKYKLDDWGYFCVDDQNETLYLASTAGINTLVKYSIKDNIIQSQ